MLHQRLSTVLLAGTVLVFIAAACGVLKTSDQPEMKRQLSLRALKLKARRAEDQNELDQSDILYQQALAEAHKLDAKADVVEILSRLVRLRIYNGKHGQIDPLVQEALVIVDALKVRTAYDPEMSVWLDDMADVIYSFGEHTSNDETKMYCLKRYLDIRLAIADHFDSQLMAKANMLTTYLEHEGRYLEALPYAEKSFSYFQQTHSNDSEAMGIAYYGLGNAYLACRNAPQAKRAFNQCLRLMDTAGPNLVWEGIVKEHLGTVEAQEGDLSAARNLYKEAIALHQRTLGKTAPFTGWDEIALGILEQDSGNFAESAKIFGTSLECFDKCASLRIKANDTVHPEGAVYSGQVVSAQHLAQIEFQQGKVGSAKLLQARVRKIRAGNSYWSTCKNPAPEDFFVISGFLPFSVQLIPNRAGSMICTDLTNIDAPTLAHKKQQR